ncbi:MAG: HAD family hydrolase [Longibaculum muris]|uniref:Cof-type HAD-IIB family hydrolase n=1 Tax=Longibaculum muris TaxID=1796628 RepID=UPI002E7716D8|nr:HAD family hydrolase [Longibaculum muris]MED9811395.1 HAD family hydrolase [Longibaculum muris]
MIKLIATDMDGTFLDSHKQFDKEFIDAFYQMKEKDIKFVVASGNQYYRLYQRFLPLSEHMYFVAENGSYIAKGTTELYCNIISKEDVERIKEILSKEDRIFMVLCGRKGAYILKEHFEYRFEIKKYYCAYTFIDSFDDIDDDIMKIAIYDKEHHINIVLDDIKDQLPKDVKVVTSGNEWMDIQNNDIHKGIGIQFLQMLYDIAPEECMAFGDQMNDYEMLQQVKYGYAMSNAVEPIKHVAYDVIGSNDEQSVISKIKEVIEGD